MGDDGDDHGFHAATRVTAQRLDALYEALQTLLHHRQSTPTTPQTRAAQQTLEMEIRRMDARLRRSHAALHEIIRIASS